MKWKYETLNVMYGEYCGMSNRAHSVGVCHYLLVARDLHLPLLRLPRTMTWGTAQMGFVEARDISLARQAGLCLFPWQCAVLTRGSTTPSTGRRPSRASTSPRVRPWCLSTALHIGRSQIWFDGNDWTFVCVQTSSLMILKTTHNPSLNPRLHLC